MTEALLPDPSARLSAAYRAIAIRMEGLPFVNAAIGVEAVGFAPWQSYWLGVMVTPWFINLMLLPRDPTAWTSLPQGKTQRHHFPAGDYDFIASRNEDIGEYQMCSLLSPVLEFADHGTARLVAEHARSALLDAANAPAAEETDRSVEGPLARIREQAHAPMSKRDFLRGRFLRDESDAARR